MSCFPEGMNVFEGLIDHAKDLGHFLEAHLAMTIGAGVSTLAISVGFTAWMIIKLPDDFFTVPQPKPNILLRIAKNLGGIVLILLGIVLSFPGVPGQGFLTILIGLMLTDIPGKQRVELFVLRRPSIYRSITKLRARYGREPLALPAGPLSTEVVSESTAAGAGLSAGEGVSSGASAVSPASRAASSPSRLSPAGGSASSVGAAAGTPGAIGAGLAAASLRDSTR